MLKTTQWVHNNMEILNEKDFDHEQVQCSINFDFSMDLPSINKTRKSAGLNCQRPIEDVANLLHEE